jgi:hypothetical protein
MEHHLAGSSVPRLNASWPALVRTRHSGLDSGQDQPDKRGPDRDNQDRDNQDRDNRESERQGGGA